MATAQLKGMSAVDLLLASHYRMAEENLALREQVGEMVSYMEAMSEAQEAMAAQLAVLVAGRDTEGSRSKADLFSAFSLPVTKYDLSNAIMSSASRKRS